VQDSKKYTSYFDELGFKESIRLMHEEVASLYLEDNVPWVIGFSGGKDSTATLQLIWGALSTIPESKLQKPVYVISTDTQVENPKVAHWVKGVLAKIDSAAKKQKLPIKTNRLVPTVENSFWVSLIGKGYPAPRPLFRWCTSRLKISPSHNFVSSLVNKYGEAILALGTRKAESAARAINMRRHESKRTRAHLSPNSQMNNCLIFTPIEDWGNDDVWLFLTRQENPWGVPNTDLLELYKEATKDRECPLVVDESTPSCGSSRFGCWVCTLVTKDASMEAMIANDKENEWLLPLCEFRNILDITDEEGKRDIRRMSGSVQLFRDSDRHIPGPYVQEHRMFLLQKLLETEAKIQELAPKGYKDITLISSEELMEIRRIWVEEKHEIEDLLPEIYNEKCSEPIPEIVERSYALPFTRDDLALLKEDVGENKYLYELCRELLSNGWNCRNMGKRAGLFSRMESAFHKSYYYDDEDALKNARTKKDKSKEIQQLSEMDGVLSI
jgi:DNA sulfur modification protein DndC